MSERWLALRDLAEEEDEGKRRVMIGKDRSIRHKARNTTCEQISDE